MTTEPTPDPSSSPGRHAGEPIVIDLDSPSLAPPTGHTTGAVICVSSRGLVTTDASERWLESSLFGLTDAEPVDSRFVRVASVSAAVSECFARMEARPLATSILSDVLGAYARHRDAAAALITESLAYSTLQSGPEFAKWLSTQGPRCRHEAERCVVLERADHRLDIAFDRPAQHNAFSDNLRAGLLDGLEIALADASVTELSLSGRGPSFCSGGDLREFGSFVDPASSHLARMVHSPAALLERLRNRLNVGLSASVHGATMGSGLEMAAFCAVITAHPDTRFGLPELMLGLIPGAGGTVSVTRRIGRWRTAYLVISGELIDATTALRWGLVDAVGDTVDDVPYSTTMNT